MGYWRGIKFWINETGTANLLLVPQLEKDGYQLEYNTTSGWLVHTPTGNIINFTMDNGMYGGMLYIDLTMDPSLYLSCRYKDKIKCGVAMVQTLRQNSKGFMKRQVKDAKRARDAQAMMAHPSDSMMRHVVSQTNALTNCPITISNIAGACTIFGPDKAGIRGESVRH